MGTLRLRRAVRDQVELRMACLDEMIPADHRVRLVWAFVETLDVSALLGRVKAFHGIKGAAATDPRLLLALWLWATLEGVGSARALARRCQSDLAYQWILGGVGMNYHTLADFRSGAGAFLDDVLTKSVAGLMKAGIASLDHVAVDSLRVRADAGSSSWRRAPTLKDLEALARERVERLKLASPKEDARRRAAEARAARERAERVAAAIEAVGAIEAARAAEDKAKRRKTPKARNPARASTTDPQARIIALAGGGFGPGYNLQVKTDPKAGVVLGVAVNAETSDRGQLAPAVAELERRYGRRPKALLADSGYDGRADIEAVETGQTAAYVPLPEAADKRAVKPGDAAGVRAWKERMAAEGSKAVYGLRANTEHAHAQMRNHGLQRMPVRGLAKVTAVALLYAVAVNLLLHGPALLARA